MTQNPTYRTLKPGIALILCTMLLFMAGCNTFTGGSSVPSDPVAETEANTPRYYGFPDVLIPGELNEDKKNTYLIQSYGFSAGILAFRGRVDRGSLIAFFRENMAKDNWQAIGSFTASQSILLFFKENRWCVITISEGDFYTYIEVGVVPKVAEGNV